MSEFVCLVGGTPGNSEAAMNHDQHNRARRGGGVAVVVAGGGVLIAALGQLATAPAARADDFTDIINDEVAVIDAGYADLGTAATDFAGADFPDGLEQTLWGVDDFLISPGELALIGSFDALTGAPVIAAAAFEFGANGGPPTDLAQTITDLQGISATAQELFSIAAADFAASDPADGFSDDIAGLDMLLIVEPEYVLMGLTDTALGL
jgi:hypothetical protein